MINIGLGIGGLLFLVWVVRSVKKWGASEHKKDEAEDDRDEAIDTARRWANRPRNWSEFSKRMQSRFNSE